ncbi:glycosyltransferase family 4 protein [Luteimonas viscosa]|uniref:Glycosyltransferase family 4 protein n=2 Tax=Luteimonas viscosa TaxID=1132694 RepID=A0A5D4XSL1_9GAMM|nr:glycosyltransferase family 4 protein [Luteimonas viscosa]
MMRENGRPSARRRRMHIVHLLLTKRFAGTERHVLELTAMQAAMGHRVTLILRRKAARARADAIAHRVDPGVQVLLVHDFLARWPAVQHARALVRGLRPDIAHAHLGSASRALRGVAGFPRLATLHIDYVPDQHAHLDGLVAIAPWQLPRIPELLRAHSTQIDNWVLPRAPGEGARERIRAAMGVGPDEFLFGALGRMEPSKGMDVLLDAFRRAAPAGARLAMAGGGRELESLRARAGPDVALPGFVEAPEDWLAAFDCFVSPSREEPFGLVLLEAMQAGLPVIATATGGGRHLAPLFGTPLVAPGDVDALAQALAEAARTRPQRQVYPLERLRVEDKARELEAFYRRFVPG